MKTFLKLLDLGDFCGFEGEFFITKHGEPSLLVTEIVPLAKTLRPLPEKFHGLTDDEARQRQRYLELTTDPSVRDRFVFRSRFIGAIRRFYESKGFLEVETPTLMHTATGAAARPYETHHHAMDMDLVLRISHELPLKMLIGGGFEKVFELGKAFRNEGIDPSHLPEHTHLEHYEAYTNFEHQMKFTEEMFDFVFDELGMDRVVEIPDRDGKLNKVNFKTPWKKLDFIEIVKKESGVDITEHNDEAKLRKVFKDKKIKIEDDDGTLSFATLVDLVYKKVVRPKLLGPVFLYNYPKDLQPLARQSDKDPEIVEQIQLVVNGWEVVKAYGELVDPIDQKERFEQQAKLSAAGDEEAMRGDDEYVVAMEHGFPPISGWGMGIDRVVTLLTGQSNLRDVIFFPTMKPENQ